MSDTAIASVPTAPDDTRLLLPLREVWRRMSICRSELYILISDNRFPVRLIRFGRAIRVRADEFEAWTRANCPHANIWNTMWKDQP